MTGGSQDLPVFLIDDHGRKLGLDRIVDLFVGHGSTLGRQVFFKLGNECGDLVF